jgi:cytochrome c553
MKEYLKYYGVTYLIFLIVIVCIGTIYIIDLPKFAEERIAGINVPVKDTTKADSLGGELPMVKGTLSPPVDVYKYLVPTPEMVEKGKTMFSTTCATCHGNEGKGDGVAGVNLNPKPRNFHEMTGWTNGPSITMMYKTLEQGITNRGMASYANVPPEDRLNLIMYIRTFNPGFPPVVKVELDSIDLQYSLAKGVKQPNQIPVKMAMEKILQEASPVDKRVDSMVALVKPNKTDTGAFILKGITNNLTKALTVLALDSTWNNNEAALIKIFDSNPVQNGFKARASYMLTKQQLTQLHAFLRNLFSQIK